MNCRVNSGLVAADDNHLVAGLRELLPTTDAGIVHAVLGRAREAVNAWVLKLTRSPDNVSGTNLAWQLVACPGSLGHADFETIAVSAPGSYSSDISLHHNRKLVDVRDDAQILRVHLTCGMLRSSSTTSTSTMATSSSSTRSASVSKSSEEENS